MNKTIVAFLMSFISNPKLIDELDKRANLDEDEREGYPKTDTVSSAFWVVLICNIQDEPVTTLLKATFLFAFAIFAVSKLITKFI